LINLDDLTLTSTGQEVKLRIERATDSAASQPISVIGDAQAIRLGILMRPWVDAIMDSGVIAAWKIREELWRD